jgi:uncharacterized protein DUF3592
MLAVIERKRDKVLRLVGTIFALLSGAFLIAAGILAAVRVASLSDMTGRGEGIVVSLVRRGRSAAPIVEYRAEGAAPARFESGIASRPPAYHVGERVAVRFDPATPGRAVIDRFWEKWLLPFIFGVIGAPYLVAAALLLAAAARIAARERALRSGGRRLAGKVVEVQPVHAGKQRMHRLIVEALDPATGEPRRYPSNPVQAAHPEETVGEAVGVLVDPGDPRRFLVDLSG